VLAQVLNRSGWARAKAGEFGMIRRVLMAALALATAFSLSGCSEGGIILPKGTLPPCSTSPTSAIHVEDLSSQTCDLTGYELIFPDGYRLKAPPRGNLTSGQICHAKHTPNPSGQTVCSGDYYASNLGGWGVDAWYVSKDRKHTTYWGTPTAVKTEKAHHAR
jgi:hypothetical protein